MQKGFVLILALIALAAGIFVYKNKTTIFKCYDCNPMIQPNPTLNDETANWRIYTSTQYAYSIKYPENLTINANLFSSQTPPDDVDFSFPKKPNKDYYFFGIGINVIDVPPSLSIDQAIDQIASRYYSVKNIQFRQIKIGGLDGLGAEVPAAYYGYDAFLLKEGKLYTFRLIGNPGDTTPVEEMNIFKQILSTFKLN